jgi:plastocyanin
VRGKVAITLLAVTATAGIASAVALAQGGPVDATSGNAFNPPTLTITAGQTVTIRDMGQGTHNLRAGNGTVLEADGTTWSYTSPALAAGTYVYYCSLHGSAMGGMRVVVTVNPASTPAPAPAPTPTPTPAPTPTPTNPTTPATDTTAPKATRVTASGTLTRAVVKLRLDEAATVTARLTRSGSTRTLKRVTRDLAAGSRQITLTRALTNGKRYRIALRIVDDAGNVTTRAISFTARR